MFSMWSMHVFAHSHTLLRGFSIAFHYISGVHFVEEYMMETDEEAKETEFQVYF